MNGVYIFPLVHYTVTELMSVNLSSESNLLLLGLQRINFSPSLDPIRFLSSHNISNLCFFFLRTCCPFSPSPPL